MEEIYGPEDIEQLLLSKDFSELYPEEREYVLRHIEGEDEYNSMRVMLLDVSTKDESIAPPAGLKEELLALHESSHNRRSFKVWLNSLFAALVPKTEWRRPALQLVGVAAAILVVTLVYRTFAPDLSTSELALEPKLEQESIPPQSIQEEQTPLTRKKEASTDKEDVQVETNPETQALDIKVNNGEVTSGNSSDVVEEENEVALDESTHIGNQREQLEIIESDIIVTSEELVAETEIISIEESEQVDVSIAADGYSDFGDKELLERQEVLASAPSASAVFESSNDEALSVNAIVPSDILTHFHTAW